MRPECRCASDWLMIAYLREFIGNTNRKLLVQFKGAENKRDLLVREVVGAQINSYWAHGRLEVPGIRWVCTNNYKFHTFHSVHFHLRLSSRPSFQFSKGLVPRLVLSLWELVHVVPCEISGMCMPGNSVIDTSPSENSAANLQNMHLLHWCTHNQSVQPHLPPPADLIADPPACLGLSVP